ncbi:MAG: ISL3 family transposase [Roseiarcus sp.]
MPGCGSQSSSVHSRYRRLIQDLPAHGRAVAVVVAARRFRCRTGTCPRSTFAERLPDAVDGSHARRSRRLDLIANQLGLALGGRPGERFANRLSLSLSADTLLRIVRKQVSLPVTRPRVVGVDDFAWRRNQRYGAVVCDLERRRIIDLLPDREMATVAAWFRDHREVEIVSRDRGGGYGEAARRELPHVLQVADRWHLFENASAAFADAVRRHMREIRQPCCARREKGLAFGSKESVCVGVDGRRSRPANPSPR